MKTRIQRLVLTIAVLLFISIPANGTTAPVAEMFSRESLEAVARSVIADQENLSRDSESEPQTRSYRPYWTLYAWLTAATIYDIETTFYLLDRCLECDEKNPITRPFVESGRLATYLFSATVNTVVMYIARRMYDRADPWWRLIPFTLTIVHGITGTWNIYQGSRGTGPP